MDIEMIEWDGVQTEADVNIIQQVEQHFNITFPTAFSEFLRKYHGAYSVNTDFSYEDPELGTFSTDFSGVFSLNTGDKNNFIRMNNLFRLGVPENIILFAIDGGGNFLCFDFANSPEPSVVYWSRDTGSPNPFHFVANSFPEFLERLYVPDDLEK
jgi:cell wall assembly regulator SMI1